MRILLASIYPFAFLLLYLIIPFDEYIRALPNILLGILVVGYPFIVSKSDFKKLVKKPTLLFIAFFLYLVLSSLIYGRIEEDLYILKKILISVGLVLLYIPVRDFEKIDKAIIFSSLAAMVFSIINVFLLNDISSFEFNNPIEILLVDRLYLGLLSILSILVSYKSIKPTYHPSNQFYVGNILLNILFVLIIGSRIAIVILLVILIVRQFYGPKKKIRLLITAGAIFIMALVLFFSNSNLVKDYFYKTGISTSNQYNQPPLNLDYRTIIWDCAYKLSISEKVSFFGNGFQATNENLVKCYNESIDDKTTKELFKQRKFNTHNQFVDMYLSTGIVGFILFTGLIMLLFIQYRKQFLPIAFLITLVLFGMTENFFNRQIGAYYVGFVLIILLSNKTFLKNTKPTSIS